MSPGRDVLKMKCLLLLLAFRLAFSDKLDRNYLPPPDAKFSGGRPDDLHTPLEYPKPSYPGITQNLPPPDNQDNTFKENLGNQDINSGSKTPIDYSDTSYLNNEQYMVPRNFIPATEKSKPEINKYNNFPPDLPNAGFLSTKQSTTDQQSYMAPASNTMFDTTPTNNANEEYDKNASGYYYYVPASKTNKNNIAKFNDAMSRSKVANPEFAQYPNQASDEYFPRSNKLFTPRVATTDDIVKNYQPDVFGYYGGNPMIMTSQNSSSQEFANLDHAPKFGAKENYIPQTPDNKNKQNTDVGTSAQPFQTPLVRTNLPKMYKSSDLTTTKFVPNYTEQPQISMFTTSSLPNKINTSFEPKQRSNPIFWLKPERPQAESDKNAIILNYNNAITPNEFSYSFNTSNGIHADESGTAIGGVKSKGSYSYIGDDGKVYIVTYTADENGFQPKGEHLPTPPPVPEAIKKVIEQAARNKAAGIIDDGSYDENKYGYKNYQGAMDRYRPFKNSNANKIIGGTAAGSNEIQTRINDQNNNGTVDSLINKDNNSLISSNRKSDNNRLTDKGTKNMVRKQEKSRYQPLKPLNKNNVGKPSITNQINSSRQRPVSVRKENQQSVSNNNVINNYRPENFTTDFKLARKSNVQDLYQNKRPETSQVNGIRQEESPRFDTFSQSLKNVLYDSQNIDPVNFDDIQDKLSQVWKPETSNTEGVTFTDNGYYYVPPLIKFNPVPNEPGTKINMYLTNNTPTQTAIDTTVSKRINTESNPNIQASIEGVISTQVPTNDDTVTVTTRKPYISGPNDNDNKKDSNESQTNFSIENNENQAFNMYNDIDFPSYVSTTTIPLQTQYRTQPANAYLNPYYQTTTNPTLLHQIQPNLLENKVNFPYGTPRVSVSQDFITTTFRPEFRDGVLEVNQNVKIYGLSRSESTVATDNFSNQVSTNNDEFYTTAVVPDKEEPRFITPDNIFGKPDQNPKTDQNSTNQGSQYGNELISTEGPVYDFSLPIPGPTINDFYGYPDIERQLEGDIGDLLNGAKSISNGLNNDGFGQSPELPTSSFIRQSSTKEIIGENFPGPKQPERFDPETGYYYK